MKHKRITGTTPTSNRPGAPLYRTNVSIHPHLWQLACAALGGTEQASEHVKMAMKKSPANSETITAALLRLIARPELLDIK